jgi:WD40 repeat protein
MIDRARQHLPSLRKRTALLAAAVLFAVGYLSAGDGLLGLSTPSPAAQASPLPPTAATPPARVDRQGDPLPEGAVARLGTVRLRPGGPIKYLAFSPDGTRLASWKEDERTTTSLSIWDTGTGRELRHVELPDVRAFAFAWLADGRGVAVLQLGDESFYIWDFTDEKAERPPVLHRPPFDTRRLREPPETHSCFALAPDGKLLAAGGSGVPNQERPVHVWELATGRLVKGLPPPRLLGRQPGTASAIAFTPDSRSLLVFSRAAGRVKEETLVVWDVAHGEQRQRMTVPLALEQRYTPYPGQGEVKVYAPAPDGRTVALGLADGTARLWDLTTGREQRSLAVIAKGPEVPYPGVSALAFSADGKHLVLGGSDYTVRVWELAGGREVRALAGPYSQTRAVAVSPDGKRIASAGYDSLIRLWDTATGAEACPQESHRHGVWGVAVAPDGRTAATASGDGTLRVWDAATGQAVRCLDLGRASRFVAFTPEGRALVGNGDQRLRLWDAATGETIRPPGPLAEQPSHLFFCFAAGGKRLATVYEGTVSVWEWPSGRLVRTIELPLDPGQPGKRLCYSLALSADGRTLATLGKRVWESKVGERTQTHVGDAAVDVWDVASGRRMHRPAALVRAGERSAPLVLNINEVGFTPDATGLLLTGSMSGAQRTPEGAKSLDAALSLFDLVTGVPRRTFGSPGARPAHRFNRFVPDAAYSPDGWTLASGEDDGSVLLFESATGLLRRRLVGHRATVVALAFLPDGKRLVTASTDNTGLVWDVSLAALAHPVAADPDGLWADLASTEPAAAHRTLASLAANPVTAVSLLKERLRPAAVPDTATLDRLVADLDSDQFPLREKAASELDRLGATAVAGLRERAAGAQTLEVRRRMGHILEKLDAAGIPAQRLRECRALELLEHLGTSEARKVLEQLARGASEADLTRDTQAALRRLEAASDR